MQSITKEIGVASYFRQMAAFPSSLNLFPMDLDRLPQVVGRMRTSGSIEQILQLFTVNESRFAGMADIQVNIDSSLSDLLTIDLNIREMTLLNQDILDAKFNGQLTLRGSKHGAILSGTLHASSPTITISEEPKTCIESVDVTFISAGKSVTQQANSLPSYPIHLDLILQISEKLAIKGKDLQSEWKGEMSIQGTAKNPLFYGTLKSVNGCYLFNGKDFLINQGTISFNGDLNKKTTLYAIAYRDLSKVKVEVIAKGPIRSPSISFRSNPPMQQREILSWILFNQGSTEITPFQGAQIHESMANIKRNANSLDVLTKIRNALGIDCLNITREEDQDHPFSLQIGKYISKNVFVSVNKSDVHSLAVEAALMKNIKMQAQINDNSKAQLFLKWKRDY